MNWVKKSFSLLAMVTAVLILLPSCKNNNKNYSSNAGQQGDLLLRVNDDTLTAFMLGGVYFFQGYGGAKATFTLVQREMKKNPGDDAFATELGKVYRKMMEYPYHRSAKDKAESIQRLTEWWEVHNPHEFHLLLSQLREKGHQDIYLQCKKMLDENGGKNADINKIDFAKYKINPEAKVLVQFVKDNYAKFSKAGVKAWDIARYVSVVCLGYSAEYIDADEGFTYLHTILADARKDYSDWKTYYSDFILGRKLWGGDQTQNDGLEKLVTDMQQGDYSIYSYLPLTQK